MISKNQIKFIKGLELKKFRKSSQSFVAEGPKLILDILPYFQCKILIAKTEWLRNHTKETSLYCKSTEIIEVNEEELLRVSFLKSPQEVLGVFTIPHHEMDLHSCARQRLCLALDDVQDPGNLGTILRSAKAFDIDTIILSENTVDLYNPKVVRATQGMLFHLNIINRELKKDLSLNHENELKKVPRYNYHKGLAIGNVTSQILAIFYLNRIDHLIKEKLSCKYYIRYMDGATV